MSTEQRTRNENMRLLEAVAVELRLRGATAVEPIADMGGEYIEFNMNFRRWAGAYGENCQLTGNADEDVWSANTYDDDDEPYTPAHPFLAGSSPVMAAADDAELIAVALIGAVKVASPGA